jgi:hypothetical protein
MTEKPKYVRVAEALRWTNLVFKAWFVNEDGSPDEAPRWHGTAPDRSYGMPLNPLWAEDIKAGRKWDEVWRVPHYDTDWAATGPLIEKYRLDLCRDQEEGYWEAIDHQRETSMWGASPLVAVCNLILKLAEAGKLDPLAE